MPDAKEKALYFLENEKAFRLGDLLTETCHPKTIQLSQTVQKDTNQGIRLLQSVDRDIPPILKKTLESEGFNNLTKAIYRALTNRKKIIFTGCGATGRLSILLESAWRDFWKSIDNINSKLENIYDLAFSVMAGGDFALIKAVEGFEDFTDFGRYQLKQVNVQAGDVVIAITEGGETSFVIGTAWQGLETGAEVFFVFNNPEDQLKKHVQRSREIILEKKITKIPLATGPMAVTGSTRMQATTVEMIVTAAAMELAICKYLKKTLSKAEYQSLGLTDKNKTDYYEDFTLLLDELENDRCISNLAKFTEMEVSVYKQKGLVTYHTDRYLLDVLTDTTERSPTFMLPPFKAADEKDLPDSWAYVKNPFLTSHETWDKILSRTPRGLDWDCETYRNIKAPESLCGNPPALDNSRIYKYMIGKEPDLTRTSAERCVLAAILSQSSSEKLLDKSSYCQWGNYTDHWLINIGTESGSEHFDKVVTIPLENRKNPLNLWERIAVKLVLNTISTATMACMSRVVGNAMSWVSPSNKKLIDRGTRLISQLTCCSYEKACIELFRAMERTGQSSSRDLSPVAAAIQNLNAQNDSI